MQNLRYYLTELCGITPHCDFRFIGCAALLPAETMRQWYDLINYARTGGKYAPLEIEPPPAHTDEVGSTWTGKQRHPDA